MNVAWDRAGLAFGVAALMSAIGVFMPVYSLYLFVVAIVLAVLAALAGDRIFSAATPAIAGLNLYFLSPVFWPTLAGMQIAEQTVFLSGLCLGMISPLVAMYLHATDMRGTNLVCGMAGIVGVLAFLGILIAWTKAIPLIVVVAIVMLLLVVDFVQSLRTGNGGGRS